MNLGEVRGIVRDEIDDLVVSNESTDQLRWSAAKLTTQILKSAFLIAIEFLHIQGTKKFSSINGTAYYAFSSTDYFLGFSGAVTALWYSDGSNWNRIPLNGHVSMDNFLALNKGSSVGSPPEAWTIWNNSLYLYPTPNYTGTDNIEVYHYKNQQSMIAITDDADELDGNSSLHMLIALNAALEISRRDKAIELSAYLEKKYDKEYKRLERLMRPPFAGPKFTRQQQF